MSSRKFRSLDDRESLNVMFLLTSMPVGGAETLLANLIRKMSPRFRPMITCLKERGELGDQIVDDVPIFSQLIRHKYDFLVLRRLKALFEQENVDAVITVGAGDKMFWGRLAARLANVPVILSALHSTGWPDGIGLANRALTSITDGFIAVAKGHGRHLVDVERFPDRKVSVIPNGIDTDRFHLDRFRRDRQRSQLGVAADEPLVGIVAALRPEKDHKLFLRTAAYVNQKMPKSKFLIVGDGPERSSLESMAQDLNLQNRVIFVGSRSDIPELLSAMDLFALTSQNEASPVSILEAMSMQLPVVSPNVGSIAESVVHDSTGYLFESRSVDRIGEYWLKILGEVEQARQFGNTGRQRVVEKSSLRVMVDGYEDLITRVYQSKFNRATRKSTPLVFQVDGGDVDVTDSSPIP